MHLYTAKDVNMQMYCAFLFQNEYTVVKFDIKKATGIAKLRTGAAG